MKVLVATEKPFAKKAVDGIRAIVEQAGMTLAMLEKYTQKEELLAAVADADALIVRSDKVTREVIQAAPRLRIVVRAGAGYDNLDLAACSERQVVAMNTPGQNSNAVAELAIGMMIYMARNQFQPGTGTELRGKTLGVHAYGNVGRLVAGLAKGFGMEVYAYDPYVPASVMQSEGVHVAATLEELYKRSDYLSLHIPANKETTGSIGQALLSLMPKGACLINTARREVINEPELEAILARRTDLKYATDVAPGNMDALKAQFDTRVFATVKKMGAETQEANINAGLAAARQIIGYLQKGDTTFCLNK
ncbi:MAG: NAD(P)-dependent oxidoreductase [Bacteroidales bacterium]|nr:NAD(P)-dependent oxidoreductase [Bacteroidales bacterium]MDD4030478.1 NAD(P)-dependent oxidoreductase [Bacteroidales bacterium]MDD4435877.1 NAD(P)-dependent oxidoreductase [Bacteroidales bacterium]MDD5733615.1 NAD(P)-dependent oxidoreductase [Bacteroidales bacterium]